MPGGNGGPAGDLEVLVTVRPHSIFGRDGNALTLTVPVTFPEAAMGTTLTVPTMDGTVTLKLPAGSSSGKRLRVRGRGIPGKTRGDFIVTIEVVVPDTLNAAATEALEAYAKATADQHDPRAHLRDSVPARGGDDS
jgi:molecular chaperone DnaJ